MQNSFDAQCFDALVPLLLVFLYVNSHLRSFSEMQFTKEYTLPSEKEKQQRVEQALIALERFVETHRPNRIYKKPNNAKKLDIKQQVRFSMCEI